MGRRWKGSLLGDADGFLGGCKKGKGNKTSAQKERHSGSEGGRQSDNTGAEEVGTRNAHGKCGDPDKEASRQSEGNPVWLPAMKKM